MFKNKRRFWFSMFLSTFLPLAAVYYFVFSGEVLNYGVTEKGQLVVKEGLGEGDPILNTDVRGEEEGLNQLGTYMNTFNIGVWGLIVVIALFFATFATLRSDSLMGNNPKRKSYLWWMWGGAIVVLTFFIVQWLRYAKFINEAIHNVIF